MNTIIVGAGIVTILAVVIAGIYFLFQNITFK